jgi:hypothetical protein
MAFQEILIPTTYPTNTVTEETTLPKIYVLPTIFAPAYQIRQGNIGMYHRRLSRQGLVNLRPLIADEFHFLLPCILQPRV